MMLVSLLVLTAPAFADNETFFFSQHFSSIVKPCIDLNEFVCNVQENPKENLFATQRKHSMDFLVNDFFLNSVDPILLQLKKIVAERVVKRDGFQQGQKLGKEAALGKIDYPTVVYTKDNKNLLLRFDEEGDNDDRGSCIYSDCIPLFRGIVTGFYNTLYPESNQTNLPLSPAIFYERYNHTNYLPTLNNAVIEKEFLQEVHDSKAPYFYMIWARDVIEKKTFPLEMIDKLKKIFGDIKQEIIYMLEECYWLSEVEKKEAIDYMNGGFTAVTGFPDLFYNASELEKAIGFMEATFGNIVKKWDKESSELELANRKPCSSPRCAHPPRPTSLRYDDGLDMGNYKSSLLAYNAFNKFTHTIITPAFIHIYKDPYPLGFIYGSIGVTIAHELFHSLGLLRKPFREHFSFHNATGIKNATQCYEDYYSSFALLEATEGDTTVLRPDGRNKLEEGFADVEGARIAFRALQRLLEKKSARSKRSSIRRLRFNLFDDFAWFFVGLASKFCSAELSFADEKYQLLEYRHPRNAIRANAVVKQMTAFTDIFHCLPDDPMHATKNICIVYPATPIH
ncbi:hypothetical protein QR680_011273 [Steinernema hermaphroditum]|uniref:Peptidase M13 C-terminal domain-containing protein n=1 Tax=Steinernema hermaphroditum TaxID=289476 RepID=A0AA39IU67_9BILA|nr:hypothetical protein QR680_011273 [Steinernema hermaphroditum]